MTKEHRYIVYGITDDGLDYVQYRTFSGLIGFEFIDSWADLQLYEYVDGWIKSDAQKIAEVLGGEIKEVNEIRQVKNNGHI
ncbi:hypothetical protein D3P96_07760 [Weissella viridescens]|uniref:Uncharacterized protein n=1 Tax=Weissella viridescens TaxID=1629 RepID=A0A3P2RF02_WEIVI|nr:hypothetical protein [Weissella viridescens]RRG17440.1 hypothetical protein D3P96_07760 [Weissella viridescens]